MRTVSCSLGMSLDGYFVGPDGRFDWTAPSDEVFAFSIEEIQGVGVHLLGRRLYESMLYWEIDEQDPSLDEAGRTWTRLWQRVPKVVFSTTLTEVRGNARLMSGGLIEEVERLRAEPGEGYIAVGGPELTHQLAAADLVDEYRIRVLPVLVGGGRPLFPQEGRRTNLELVESRTFSNGFVYLHHRVVR
jgi:dihydrofolate reductase